MTEFCKTRHSFKLLLSLDDNKVQINRPKYGYGLNNAIQLAKDIFEIFHSLIKKK